MMARRVIANTLIGLFVASACCCVSGALSGLTAVTAACAPPLEKYSAALAAGATEALAHNKSVVMAVVGGNATLGAMVTLIEGVHGVAQLKPCYAEIELSEGWSALSHGVGAGGGQRRA
jgi:hypothetical protein